MNFKTEDNDRYVVRLRGLPWSCSDSEIIEFLGVRIVGGPDGIKRTLTREGRSSGEAYVELETASDMNKTLDKDRELMGKRYIEVFSSSYKEMAYVLDRTCRQRETGKTIAGNDTIVRLRGLPYICTKDDIAQFFTGLDIVHNGIVLPLDSSGRSTGESFVEFSTSEDASAGLGKHKDKIGHRYIEIFNSTRREMREAQSMDRGARIRPGYRPTPYDRPRGGGRERMLDYDRRRRMDLGGYGDYYDEETDEFEEDDYYEDDWDYDMRYGRRVPLEGRPTRLSNSGWYDYDYYDDDEIDADYVVHMRGLPFKATIEDIDNFFSPIVPVRIYRQYGSDGRISGEADVEFASYQDAQAAMQKNRELIKHRYIELFYRGSKSKPVMRGRGHSRGMPHRSRPMLRDRPPPPMRHPRGLMRGRNGPMRGRNRYPY